MQFRLRWLFVCALAKRHRFVTVIAILVVAMAAFAATPAALPTGIEFRELVAWGFAVLGGWTGWRQYQKASKKEAEQELDARIRSVSQTDAHGEKLDRIEGKLDDLTANVGDVRERVARMEGANEAEAKADSVGSRIPVRAAAYVER